MLASRRRGCIDDLMLFVKVFVDALIALRRKRGGKLSTVCVKWVGESGEIGWVVGQSG